MPDAVVIGAGPNGLAAAARLAEAGREVLVLDAAGHVGGAIHSAEATLPGFVHDLWSSVYPTAAASPVLARLRLEEHGLRWLHGAACMAQPLADGDAVALYRSVEETAAGLERAEPGSGERYEAAFAPLAEAWAQLGPLALGPFLPSARGAARALAALGPSTTALSLGLALRPVDRTAGALGGRAASLLAGSALHADLPFRVRGSLLPALVLHLQGHVAGWPIPAGGAQALAAALERAARSRGVALQTSTSVERIVAPHGVVLGVVAEGSFIPCREVVACVTPAALERLLDGAGPQRWSRRLRSWRRADGVVKVDWALSGPIPWPAEICRRVACLHLGGDLAALRAQDRERRAGVLPAQPFAIVGQPSVVDPSRAPAGRHVAWAYTRVPAGRGRGDDLQRVADLLERELERCAPGFAALILARLAQGPDELERANRNLAGGDVGGGSYEGQLVRRLPTRTPVDGLVLGSASTLPGGGAHGVCGDNAALALIGRRP